MAKAAKRGRPKKAKEPKNLTEPTKKRGRPKKDPTLNIEFTAPDVFQDQVKTVLGHLLKVLEASLLDMFKQYVENMMKTGNPASAEHFLTQFKHSAAVHGISKEKLLMALEDDIEREYVTEGPGSAIRGLQVGEAAQPQQLDLQFTGQVKSALDRSFVGGPLDPASEAPPTEEKTPQVNKTSVFDNLDLL